MVTMQTESMLHERHEFIQKRKAQVVFPIFRYLSRTIYRQ
jgi:hypothetical protein